MAEEAPRTDEVTLSEAEQKKFGQLTGEEYQRTADTSGVEAGSDGAEIKDAALDTPDGKATPDLDALAQPQVGEHVDPAHAYDKWEQGGDLSPEEIAEGRQLNNDFWGTNQATEESAATTSGDVTAAPAASTQDELGKRVDEAIQEVQDDEARVSDDVPSVPRQADGELSDTADPDPLKDMLGSADAAAERDDQEPDEDSQE